MSISADTLKRRLRVAYGKAKAENVALISKLEALEVEADTPTRGGTPQSVSANRRSTVWANDDGGQITIEQNAQIYTLLLTGCRKSKRYLTWCSRYDVDPQDAEDEGISSPSGDAVPEPDAVTDADVFEWLMGSDEVDNSARAWGNHIDWARSENVTEVMSDYSESL